MYLKRLEIHGFKSFADKTVLSFASSGQGAHSVTAIVGPNGSGKSNVADAIRWVMGEQSMKHLRGKKSEDIIFAGSEGKGNMSRAEVSMVLDNTDQRMPIDSEEVVISRRLYRTGESEYLVNGHAVRLLDLNLLLAKAQFAHGSYSVIGQGTIDRLLLQTPEERKDFFDEATGIKEFQIKRHQASLKLIRTREHITQAEVVLNEVAPRLRTLSRQVKKLEERHEVEQSLQEWQERYYTTIVTQQKHDLEKQETELARLTNLYTEAEGKLRAIQTELAALARDTSSQDAFAKLQEQLQHAMREKNAIERDVAVLSGRLQTEYSKAGQQQVGWLEKKIEELTREQEMLARELADAEAAAEKASTDIVEQKDQVSSLSIRRTELKGRIAEAEHRIIQAKSGEAVMQMTGQRAVMAVLERRHEFGDVYGAVAQLASVPERFQLAMDVAAGSHLSSLVVGTDRVASACIQYLRDAQLGVATFLPLNKIKPRMLSNDLSGILSQKGVYGLAVELVSFDKKFSDIFSYIFGNTIVVEDLATAREIGIGRVRMVTLAGDMLETSGSMRGGFRRRDRHGLSFSNSLTARTHGDLAEEEKSRDRLQQELFAADTAYERAIEEMRAAEGRAQLSASKASGLGDRKGAIDRELAGFTQERELATMTPGDYDVVMKNLSSEKDAMIARLDEADGAVRAAEKAMVRFQQEEEDKKQRVFSLQEAMQSAQHELNTIAGEKNQIDIAIAKLETKQEDLANELFQELRLSPESLLSRGIAVLSSEELGNAQSEIQKLKYKLSLIGGIDEEVIREFAETKEKHDALVSQLDDLNKAFIDLETMIEELDETMKKKRDKAFREMKKEFSRYFALLFEGGKAELLEVYGNDTDDANGELENSAFAPSSGRGELRIGDGSVVSEQSEGEGERPAKKAKKEVLIGIDVSANPPGKKIKNIQALSGGERTMTSIALVCAILHTNPSPFVILDEVEAALDEANTLRFTTILKELAGQSQFILITHNRATMHAADALYGVTMGNEGVSKLLSVKLEKGS